jgi:putative ABC transport system permease protein
MAVTVDLRVMAVSLLVSLLTGLGFGLIPALQASAVSPLAGRARRRGRMTRRLIVIELAMAVVLLAGFLLLFRSVERLYAISAGFDPGRVLITGSDAGRSFPEAMSFWRAALARAREVPGVVSVAVTSRPPLHGARRQHFLVEGQPSAAPEAAPEAGDILISEDYFRTLGIAIVKGRGFDRTDNEASRPVAVISETLARRYFPDRSPIGSRVRVLERAPMTCCTAPGPVDGVWREVVGVVADVRQANLDEPPAATLYRPYSQIVEHDMFLVARSGSAAQSGRIANELQSRLDALDATREWWPVRGMSRVIRDSESIRLRRFVLILLGGFATVALLLAAIGVYGVASGAIAERTHEIGVRIALGATSPAIFRELVGEMMALAAAGLALGCAGTVALVRLIRAMLFGVGAADPATFAGVTLVLAGVVFVAASLPARRATRVDPLTALRHE